MINVLIVDDAPIVRKVLISLLNSDADIHVSEAVQNGAEAISYLKNKKIDIVIMDLNMPKMNGIEATKQIMATNPVPIIILTAGGQLDEGTNSFNALEAGAVAVILKPANKEEALKFLNTIKVMAEVKVVQRSLKYPAIAINKVLGPSKNNETELIAMGASTGGPPIIQRILKNITLDFPPILLVQHISTGFVDYMAQWLQDTTKIPIHVAVNSEKVLPGNVYIAPDNAQMGITKNFHIDLNKSAPQENGVKPAVSYLFRSVAAAFGHQSMGILLTGMGHDGAKELKLLKDNGAITICQDKESCVVFGMPCVAQKYDAAKFILNPEEIASMISRSRIHAK